MWYQGLDALTAVCCRGCAQVATAKSRKSSTMPCCYVIIGVVLSQSLSTLDFPIQTLCAMLEPAVLEPAQVATAKGRKFSMTPYFSIIIGVTLSVLLCIMMTFLKRVLRNRRLRRALATFPPPFPLPCLQPPRLSRATDAHAPILIRWLSYCVALLCAACCC